MLRFSQPPLVERRRQHGRDALERHEGARMRMKMPLGVKAHGPRLSWQRAEGLADRLLVYGHDHLGMLPPRGDQPLHVRHSARASNAASTTVQEARSTGAIARDSVVPVAAQTEHLSDARLASAVPEQRRKLPQDLVLRTSRSLGRGLSRGGIRSARWRRHHAQAAHLASCWSTNSQKLARTVERSTSSKPPACVFLRDPKDPSARQHASGATGG